MLISLVSVVVIVIPGSDQYPEQATGSPYLCTYAIPSDDSKNTEDNRQSIDPFHFPSFFLIVCNCFKVSFNSSNFCRLTSFLMLPRLFRKEEIFALFISIS